ncbi:MAG: glycosyltransferase family 2 protein [Rhizobacter sp.]|nr:glycosyltransferase family 2 protein [Rhizobacter sp.]
MRYTVVIPVLNQLHYTRQCVASLRAAGVPAEAILVIDNASTDDTAAWLAQTPDARSVHNDVNLGCGGAWTQGCYLAEGDWVVLLNNDVLAGPNAIDAMLDAAERHGLDVVSPALLEGPDDYDFAAFAPAYCEQMKDELRRGWFHGVCFAIRRSVFHRIGYPDTDRLMWGHEDKEYLVRCLRAGIPVGTVGGSVFHHFGSITQAAMKREQNIKKLGDHRHAYRRMGMGWWERRRFKRRQGRESTDWAHAEGARHGITLHMLRTDGSWRLL